MNRSSKSTVVSRIVIRSGKTTDGYVISPIDNTPSFGEYPAISPKVKRSVELASGAVDQQDTALPTQAWACLNGIPRPTR